MVHLDLFSGITGFALAASWVWGEEHEIHCFVEIDPFCQKVIKKHWPGVPIHGDIKTYEHNGTKIDLLTGGFPCQPFSVAGKQRGKADDRALWPEMLRIIKEAKPRWIIGENVTGIVNMELDNYVSDLEAEGYEVQPFIIPACAVDAPHRRDRVWIVGHTSSGRCDTGGNNKQGGYFCKTEIGATTENQQTGYGRELRFSERSSSQNVANPTSGEIWNGTASKRVENEGRGTTKTRRKAVRSREKTPFGSDSGQGGKDVADTDRNGTQWNQSKNREGCRIEQEGEDAPSTFSQYDDGSGYGSGSVCGKQSGQAKIQGCGEWLPEPSICELDNGLPSGLVRYRGRVATGVKDRVNKLKALGNAICPQVVVPIMEAIKEIDYAKRHTTNSRHFR